MSWRWICFKISSIWESVFVWSSWFVKYPVKLFFLKPWFSLEEMDTSCKRTVVCCENKCRTSCAIIDNKNCWSLWGIKGCNFSPLKQGERICRSLLSGIVTSSLLFVCSLMCFLKHSPLIDRKLKSLASHTSIRLLLQPSLMLIKYKWSWSPTQRKLFMLMGSSWNQQLHIITRFHASIFSSCFWKTLCKSFCICH